MFQKQLADIFEADRDRERADLARVARLRGPRPDAGRARGRRLLTVLGSAALALAVTSVLIRLVGEGG